MHGMDKRMAEFHSPDPARGVRRFAFQHFSVLLLAAICLLALLPAVGESLPFDKLDDIKGPYDGMGASGEALYVLPLGMAGSWPIRAVWSSACSTRSPYLGFGWRVPALESRFVRLDERRSAFYQPDGYVRIFVPAKNGRKNVLTGGPAWEAVIDEDSIRVTADPHDGAPKSVFYFSNGRLVRMDCEEGSFEIKYEDRVATSIVSRGRQLLKVVRHPPPEKSTEFRFSGANSKVTAVCRPVAVFVEPEDSRSASAVAQEDCLASLVKADGTQNFSYGAAAGSAFFDVDGLRWTWSPHTRKLLRFGNWTYTIGSTAGMDEEVSFSRCNVDGRSESYSSNRKTGLVMQRYTNGLTIEYRMFTSGPLAYRRVRWIKKTERDGTITNAEYKYNKEGRLWYRKTSRRGSTVELWLNDSGRVIRRREDGKEVPLR